jgi:hypothetical protein
VGYDFEKLGQYSLVEFLNQQLCLFRCSVQNNFSFLLWIIGGFCISYSTSLSFISYCCGVDKFDFNASAYHDW